MEAFLAKKEKWSCEREKEIYKNNMYVTPKIQM